MKSQEYRYFLVLPKCNRNNKCLHKTLFAGASSACPGDEGLIESWFEEQMDDEGLPTEEKAPKPW